MRKLKRFIVNWLINQVEGAKKDGFVVGVSGGVDSALVSTLCALTGSTTLAVVIPIGIKNDSNRRALKHINWMKDKYPNVAHLDIHLFNAFHAFKMSVSPPARTNDLVMANLQSRMRMCALYAEANARNLLVCGTGNKVEDYGVGFFTKYGDGGVDMSPIGDLTKSQVRDLAIWLEINPKILSAAPTDDLWDDGRTDESQLGATYEELEWAMDYFNTPEIRQITKRQKQVFEIFVERHIKNEHKVNLPPVCHIPDKKKE